MNDAYTLRGARICSGYLDRAMQERLVADVRQVARQAPLFAPMTPYGKRMSVQMTSAGRFGWVSDRKGYRYSETHPDGMAWPDIPDTVLALWRDLVPEARPPECCLINYYDDSARMGMHQDRDEKDFTQPVLSVSLGDDALFRIGNSQRGGKTQSVWLASGDVVVLEGDARLRYHGVDRLRPGSSTLLPKGGRINLTLRVVS